MSHVRHWLGTFAGLVSPYRAPLPQAQSASAAEAAANASRLNHSRRLSFEWMDFVWGWGVTTRCPAEEGGTE